MRASHALPIRLMCPPSSKFDDGKRALRQVALHVMLPLFGLSRTSSGLTLAVRGSASVPDTAVQEVQPVGSLGSSLSLEVRRSRL